MIINNIELTNFRCYYGTNKISFSSDNKITLIYGQSGYGKTSLLQFLNWMLYGKDKFAENDDKPFFNISSYIEAKKQGIKTLEVVGRLDFEHLGSKYRLVRSRSYHVSVDMMSCPFLGEECKLHVMSKDELGYHPFNGDIGNQINKILPIELSKYFLLYGEESRTIVLNSNELRKAIHSLFGIDKYTEAISHIGSESSKTTVLGHYATNWAKEAGNSTDKSIPEMQEKLQDQYEKIEKTKQKAKTISEDLQEKRDRYAELLLKLGENNNKTSIKDYVDLCQKQIDGLEEQIKEQQKNIGALFYSAYSYLFLEEAIRDTSSVLRANKADFAGIEGNVFQDLSRRLLEDIQKKGVCVCGRDLDSTAKDYISRTIATMPPNSYIYSFRQYVDNSKKMILKSTEDSMRYHDFLDKITTFQGQIDELNNTMDKKLDDLKKLEQSKEIVEEFEQVKKDIEYLEKQKERYNDAISQMNCAYNQNKRTFEKTRNKVEVANRYRSDIDFFTHIVDKLKDAKKKMEDEVRITINNCVREVYKRITTQTDVDPETINFVQDDFSLRDPYLSGGQLSVDVYSYVIGIVKALQECNMDTNENPIIVDAPFAFTDNAQSEHIFRTLPKVCKQTILLTLDLNKIRDALSDTDLYDFYIIQNDTQEKATIVRGDVNAIDY